VEFVETKLVSTKFVETKLVSTKLVETIPLLFCAVSIIYYSPLLIPPTIS
jgi:hypothetical protein